MESTDAKSLIINRSPSRYKLFKHSGGNHQNQAQFRRTQDHSEELFQKLQQIFKQFPGSKRVRSAYASVCGKMYASRENRTRDVPSKLIGKLKKWSAQYPDDIEFQEALFDVTLYHLTYAQGQGLRTEELRAFHALERIAKTANYAVYLEENTLLPRVEKLRQLFGYGPERH